MSRETKHPHTVKSASLIEVSQDASIFSSSFIQCLLSLPLRSLSVSLCTLCLPVLLPRLVRHPCPKNSSSRTRERYEGRRRWKETRRVKKRVKKKGSEKGSQWCPSLFIPASLKPNGDSSDRSSRLTFGWDSSCLHSMKGLHYNEDS